METGGGDKLVLHGQAGPWLALSPLAAPGWGTLGGRRSEDRGCGTGRPAATHAGALRCLTVIERCGAIISEKKGRFCLFFYGKSRKNGGHFLAPFLGTQDFASNLGGDFLRPQKWVQKMAPYFLPGAKRFLFRTLRNCSAERLIVDVLGRCFLIDRN